jgi:ubiquinone/menaquinone biosynthesis C-methylase UbiE
MSPNSSFRYPLGSSDAEHERLIRQAAWVDPYTERFFRDAGIGLEQRVLDLGSGVGDVAMIAARLVGPSGEVVGVEGDPRSIARARARVAEAGLHNISFIQSDVCRFPEDQLFDAVVGRYILMFLPDPVAALRSVAQVVRPGGVVAFQESCFTSFLRLAAPLPLWAASASLMIETFQRAGANTEMGPALPRIFQGAGLPAPSVHVETLLGAEPWMAGVLQSLRPQIGGLNLSYEALGDLDTLPERLQAEVAASNAVTPLPLIFGAWARRPQ